MTEEQITFLIQRRNIIPIIRKFQTYKEYPLDLYCREFIIMMRMTESELHQVMNGEKKWLGYTW